MACTSNSFLSAAMARNLARNNSVIFEEICAIQQAILTAANTSGVYSLTIDGNTPLTSHCGITDVIVAYGGTGYLTGEPVVITDVTGSGFTGTIIASGGVVNDVTITVDGQNYSTASAASITSVGGSAAILTILTDSQKFGNIDSSAYYDVWAELVTDVAISDQLSYIEKYFTDLGYNFQIRINPTTMNTLQWQIYW